MERRTLKTLAFTAFFVAVGALTLGYASLTQSLNINSTASVQNASSSWNIKFTNGSSGTATNYASKGTLSLQDTSATISGIILKAPKDSVTYTWDLVNAGQIDAELAFVQATTPTFTGSGATKTADEELVASMYEYSLTWSDDTEIKEGVTLSKGETKHIKLVISYKESATQLPTNPVTIGNLGLTLSFVQKGYSISEGGGIPDTNQKTPGLYDANGNLVVSYESSGMDVSKNYTSAYETDASSPYVILQNYPTVTEIVIPSSVTSIGSLAFYGCTSLTSVVIPSSVTSIGEAAFASCESLRSVTIPSSVTSIGRLAFRECINLQSVTIPSSVTSTGEGTFNGCESLQSVTIENGVTSIGEYAFGGCESLRSVTIPSSVTSIGNGAFTDCKSLQSITIPNSVTSIGSLAFLGCESLRSVTIPSSVTSIGNGAFNYVPHIIYNGTAIDEYENNWGARTINGYIEGDFVYSDSTKSQLIIYIGNASIVTIPNSVTRIEEGAFYSTSLQSVTIPSSVTSIGEYAFGYCESLQSVTIPSSVTTIGDGAFEGIPHIYYNGTATGSSWGAKAID